MASDQSHRRKSSVLGESWVVADASETASVQPESEGTEGTTLQTSNAHSQETTISSEPAITPLSSFSESEFLAEYQEPEQPPSPAHNLNNNNPPLSDSTFTFASSGSGPELIMPSISFDMNTSTNTSWVIPQKRSKQPASESQRKAPKRMITPPSRPKQSKVAKVTPPSSERMKGYAHHMKSFVAATFAQKKFLWMTVNTLLLLAVTHLLILPELLYQFPNICRIPSAQTLYPTICMTSNQTVSNIIHGPPANYQSAIRTQSQLQDYLNFTLAKMAPLEQHLKENDAAFREVYSNIRTAYPGARNEIGLEFDGAWSALRTVSRDFLTLKVDIKAVTNSLDSTHSRGIVKDIQNLPSQPNGNRGMLSRILSPGGAAVTADGEDESTRLLAHQLVRFEQSLDATISRLRFKTDALLARLGTLDDHLQSIQRLVLRERERLRTGSDQTKGHHAWKTYFSKAHGDGANTPEDDVLGELERIATHHVLIADVVGRLDSELKALQTVRAIRV